jgi:hypothetical protein
MYGIPTRYVYHCNGSIDGKIGMLVAEKIYPSATQPAVAAVIREILNSSLQPADTLLRSQQGLTSCFLI